MWAYLFWKYLSIWISRRSGNMNRMLRRRKETLLFECKSHLMELQMIICKHVSYQRTKVVQRTFLLSLFSCPWVTLFQICYSKLLIKLKITFFSPRKTTIPVFTSKWGVKFYSMSLNTCLFLKLQYVIHIKMLTY